MILAVVDLVSRHPRSHLLEVSLLYRLHSLSGQEVFLAGCGLAVSFRRDRECLVRVFAAVRNDRRTLNLLW